MLELPTLDNAIRRQTCDTRSSSVSRCGASRVTFHPAATQAVQPSLPSFVNCEKPTKRTPWGPNDTAHYIIVPDTPSRDVIDKAWEWVERRGSRFGQPARQPRLVVPPAVSPDDSCSRDEASRQTPFHRQGGCTANNVLTARSIMEGRQFVPKAYKKRHILSLDPRLPHHHHRPSRTLSIEQHELFVTVVFALLLVAASTAQACNCDLVKSAARQGEYRPKHIPSQDDAKLTWEMLNFLCSKQSTNSLYL